MADRTPFLKGMPLPSCVCGHHFRYVILCLGLLCLTSVCSNYIVINFTFICMVSDDEKIDIGNGTMVGRYEYSPLEKGAITWAVAAGTIIGTVPINFWYIKSGARWPFFVSGMMSVFSTAALPLVAFLGLPYLLVFRFVQVGLFCTTECSCCEFQQTRQFLGILNDVKVRKVLVIASAALKLKG
ncbi:MFS domain-containing protein [Trichostrongylus colubriformis]|uniref:MFS domain-containing protein n=1 Tax=Trichostrongylus colubriformis TaxID=6319 RepID=A0AAN8F4A9_TRICO